jgi:hypothetical protein
MGSEIFPSRNLKPAPVDHISVLPDDVRRRILLA